MTIYSGPFYLHQLGYNDHKRCLDLLRNNIGSGAILNPDDFTGSRESLFASTIQEYQASGLELLIDPQGFNPGRALTPNPAIGEESKIFQDEMLCLSYVQERLNFQLSSGASMLLVPGYETDDLSVNWKADISRFARIAVTYWEEQGYSIPLLSTIAVNKTVVRSEERRQELLDQLMELKGLVGGIYLIIVDIPTFTNDVSLLAGIIEIVFYLEWHKLSVLLGYSGPWAMLAFPFGLDRFANSGLKNRQTFASKRREQPKGWGPPGGKQYHDYYSLDLLGYLRYPDDFQGLPPVERERILRRRSVYSPPEDQDPGVVKEANLWERGTSQQDFSAKMDSMAMEFRGKTLDQRIELVRANLNRAQQERNRLSRISSLALTPYVDAWSEAFEIALSQLGADLRFEFG